MAKKFGFSAFYHMTHIANLIGICTLGILSHSEASKRDLIKKDISDENVQMLRNRVDPWYGRTIHSYVPLYIKPRNPMLYVRRDLQDSICILEVDLTVIDNSEYLLTDGNAAAHNTKFFTSIDGFRELPWDVLNTTSWNDKNDGKRKMCAEVLVYPYIPAHYIKRLHFIKYPSNDLMLAIQISKEITPTLFF